MADGVERATIESFNFNWQLAMWEHVLQKTADKDQKVPVIGYVVTNVTRPNSCPGDVYAALNGNQVEVSWSPIQQEDLVNNDLLVGYKVFRSIDGGDKELIAHLKVTTQPDGKQTLETLYTDNTTQIDDGKICSYSVAAVYNKLNGETYTSIASDPSSVVWGVGGVDGSVTKMPLTGTVFGSGEMLPYLLMIIILVVSIGWPIIVQKKDLFRK